MANAKKSTAAVRTKITAANRDKKQGVPPTEKQARIDAVHRGQKWSAKGQAKVVSAIRRTNPRRAG